MVEMKPCPVDRGKLLIGLECCRSCGGNECRECPYDFCEHLNCTQHMAEDALAYIGYLEAEYDKLAVENADLREQLEAAKPKGAYLAMYEDGEDILFDCSTEGDTADFRMLAMAGLKLVMQYGRLYLGGSEGDEFVQETQNALMPDSPFWDFSEDAD